MIPQKLQEMDVVLRRDGTVCWILKDDGVGRLRLFGLDFIPYGLIKNYKYDFTYGKDLYLEDSGEIVLKNLYKYDIVAVSGLDSTVKKLLVARNYEKFLNSGDEITKKHWFDMFNWNYTDAFWGDYRYKNR